MARIFDTKLLREINTPQMAQEMAAALSRNVKGSFNRSKQDFLALFAAHPITREIKEGVGAQNISNTMQGYGDLYSFLGFTDDPIENIKRVLLDNINLSEPRVVFNNAQEQWEVEYEVSVNLNAIYDATRGQLDWAPSLSWIEAVENGLLNLGFFISREGIGRSGGGIQAKKVVRASNKFQPKSYVREIAEIFVKSKGVIKIV